MTVTADDLKAEELRLRYSELLDDPAVYPTRANWHYIIEHRMEGIGDRLLARYKAALAVDDVDRDELHGVAIDEFPRYLAAVDRAYALEVVYGDTGDAAVTASLIRSCGLFDADRIAALIEAGDTSLAVSVLDVYQPVYDEDTLDAMRRLQAVLGQLPVLGTFEQRRGLLGVTRKYICPRGHVNDTTARYCRHSGCGLDEYGLTEADAAAIDLYRRRVAALASLLEP